MKRFISLFLLFLAFFVVFYISMVFITGNYGPGFLKKNLVYKLGGYGHSYSRIKEVSRYKDIDILFMGSSHSYRGFDPRIFRKSGSQVFNLGSSSQSPIQEDLLLTQYLDKLKPKLIVFEMFPNVYESDGVESSLDILSNNPIDYQTLIMSLRTNNMKTYNTLIYAYLRQIFKLNDGFAESSFKGKDIYVPGGFVERKLSFYKATPKDSKVKKYHLNSMQISVFNNVLKKISDKNIHFILVQAPITKKLYNSYINNVHIDSIYSSWGRYYNFNKILQLDDSLFYDSHHLNQRGVEVFNQSFIELLKKENLLGT